MPRLPRYLLPAEGIYHVTARGVARGPIALDDDDRRLFLALLAQAVRREDWNCHAFCLMPNHYHLIVATHLERLSRGLHRLNGVVAQAFNERHDRSGHLFGDRFAAFAIRDDDHLRDATQYVLQNPVRAGLSKRAEDWPWSGSRRAPSILTPCPGMSSKARSRSSPAAVAASVRTSRASWRTPVLASP